MLVWNQNRCLDPGLLDEIDIDRIRHVGRIVELLHRAIIHMQAVNHRRRGGDEINAEFAVDALAHDLQMQQPQEAATKTKTERGRGFHFIGKARIVEMKPS